MNMHSSVRAVPIGEILRPVRSWNPRSLTDGERIDYIDIGSVSQSEKAILPIQPIDAATAPSRARQLVAADDILISTVRPNLNAVARVTEPLDGATASTGFCVLRPDPKRLDPGYLFHWVRAPAFVEDMTRNATGQSYPAVSDRIVKQSAIPLPPLAEQKRIAAILDQADALRRLRRRALDRLNTLGQAIFQEMFGDPERNRHDLPVAPLAQVATFTSGATPSKANSAFWTGGIPWVTPKDMKRKEIVSSEDNVSPAAVASSPLKMVPAGTPLIVVRGMILAHTIPMALTGVDCTINQDMKAINFDQRIIPEFGLYCLRAQHENMLKRIDTAAHGTRRFDMSRLGETPILMAEASDQRCFVEALALASAMEADAKKAHEISDPLFSSLQHRAFTGQL